ncbi:hypothetical protein QT971_14075 [Microcoleus sp. herbarium19]|uniref:hypothetical protein n=1 Tax=unclassified Microcoleus TaxID=2642155 RepID=UPI002FCEAE8C
MSNKKTVIAVISITKNTRTIALSAGIYFKSPFSINLEKFSLCRSVAQREFSNCGATDSVYILDKRCGRSGTVRRTLRHNTHRGGKQPETITQLCIDGVQSVSGAGSNPSHKPEIRPGFRDTAPTKSKLL